MSSLADKLLDEESNIMLTSFDDVSTNPESVLPIYFQVQNIDGELIPSDESIKKLGVQYDKNMTVIQFRCPRYYMNKDLSEFDIYVIYERADTVPGKSKCKIVESETTSSTIYFNWIIPEHITFVSGFVNFLVCFKATNTSTGTDTHMLHTEIFSGAFISKGLKEPNSTNDDSGDTGGDSGDTGGDSGDTGGDSGDTGDEPVYTPIEIISFSINPTIIEYGGNESVTVSWELSAIPERLTLSYGATTYNQQLSKTGSTTVELDSATKNVVFTLTAVGNSTAEDVATQTKTTSVGHYVYYGTCAKQDTIDSDFVKNLPMSKLRSIKMTKIQVDAENNLANTYMYYCHPKSFGECSFTWVSPDEEYRWGVEFDGPTEVTITNDSGENVDYYVYRAIEANPGIDLKYEIK